MSKTQSLKSRCFESKNKNKTKKGYMNVMMNYTVL